MSDYRPTGFQIMPPVVKNLLIINGIVFLATNVLAKNMEIDLFRYGALHFFTSESFMPHQIVTHLFLHGSFTHILFNMLTLWMFGSMLENFWGSKRFLIFYMICGIGASFTHQTYTAYKLWPAFQYQSSHSLVDFRELVNRNESLLETASEDPRYAEYAPVEMEELAIKAEKEPNNTFYSDLVDSRVENIKVTLEGIPTVGASGAIYGLLMAFGMIFPNMIIQMFFLIPMKAKHFVILMIVVGVVFGFADLPGDQVAHFAHLGGMAFGFLMIKFWNRNRTQNF